MVAPLLCPPDLTPAVPELRSHVRHGGNLLNKSVLDCPSGPCVFDTITPRANDPSPRAVARWIFEDISFIENDAILFQIPCSPGWSPALDVLKPEKRVEAVLFDQVSNPYPKLIWPLSAYIVLFQVTSATRAGRLHGVLLLLET